MPKASGFYFKTEEELQRTVDDLEEQRDDLLDEIQHLKEINESLQHQIDVLEKFNSDQLKDIGDLARKYGFE